MTSLKITEIRTCQAYPAQFVYHSTPTPSIRLDFLDAAGQEDSCVIMSHRIPHVQLNMELIETELTIDITEEYLLPSAVTYPNGDNTFREYANTIFIADSIAGIVVAALHQEAVLQKGPDSWWYEAIVGDYHATSSTHKFFNPVRSDLTRHELLWDNLYVVDGVDNTSHRTLILEGVHPVVFMLIMNRFCADLTSENPKFDGIHAAARMLYKTDEKVRSSISTVLKIGYRGSGQHFYSNLDPTKEYQPEFGQKKVHRRTVRHFVRDTTLTPPNKRKSDILEGKIYNYVISCDPKVPPPTDVVVFALRMHLLGGRDRVGTPNWINFVASKLLAAVPRGEAAIDAELRTQFGIPSHYFFVDAAQFLELFKSLSGSNFEIPLQIHDSLTALFTKILYFEMAWGRTRPIDGIQKISTTDPLPINNWVISYHSSTTHSSISQVLYQTPIAPTFQGMFFRTMLTNANFKTKGTKRASPAKKASAAKKMKK